MFNNLKFFTLPKKQQDNDKADAISSNDIDFNETEYNNEIIDGNMVNLIDMLRDAPIGTKLWSSIFGEVSLTEVKEDEEKIICHTSSNFPGWGNTATFNKYGQLFLSPTINNNLSKDIVLFPSNDDNDWSLFIAPWKHKQFKPFEKVLYLKYDDIHRKYIWLPGFYSHSMECKYFVTGDYSCLNEEDIVPYEGNEDLYGKTQE